MELFIEGKGVPILEVESIDFFKHKWYNYDFYCYLW